MLAPLLLKLVFKDLRTPLPREPGVVEAELAHLHVVLAGQQEHRLPPRVQLHLPTDPVPVEVGKPPALRSFVTSWFDERDPEETLAG